jgi:hypothetical protein
VLLQSLQHVRTIAVPIKFRKFGELTVHNLRQPDHRLKIELRPFGNHVVEYFAAVPPPRATAEEVLSKFLV